MNSSEFAIALLKCPGIGTTKALKYILDNKKILEKCYSNIDKIISKNDFETYLNQAKEEIELNKSKNIEIVTIFDKAFPSKLYTISDPVLYLYYFGNINLLDKPSVAIIGTRHPSDKSINKTKDLTKIISSKYVIVAGLALGIDSVAHKAAVDNNEKTIAVLPAGIDNIQPTSNKNLAKEIALKDGLLISEYSSGVKLSNYNYAKRDRIQTALSNLIIVPEAKETSGTMIAVNKAYKEGKKVYQLFGNNNKKIDDSISLDDDILKILDKDIKNDMLLEKNKKELLLNNNKKEQISLF